LADLDISRPATMLKGEENRILQEKIWKNILDALRKDNPDVDQSLSR
jgi:hypothetical protein